jgi:hypothetical protein
MEMSFLILFISIFLCISKANLSPTEHNDEANSSTLNPDVSKDHNTGDLELVLKNNYPDGYSTFTFLSELKGVIKKDPLKPQSPKTILEINGFYTAQPFCFMRTLNSLYDEELVLHVCLMLKKYEKDEIYVEWLNECYMEGSYHIHPENAIQVIFECFDELIQNLMKGAFSDSKEKTIVLNTRKHLAHLMLSILQRVSFSPFVEIEVPFTTQKLSTRFYYRIINGFIVRLTTASFWGSKTTSRQLHKLNKRFSGTIPSQVGESEEIFILLLLFQHYSYFIVKYDFAEVDLHWVEPNFLARIAVAANESSMSYLFRSFNCISLAANESLLSHLFISFNTRKLLLNGIKSFYCFNLNPTADCILDFTKESHNIPTIPDDREDLQWILNAYNKLLLYVVEK